MDTFFGQPDKYISHQYPSLQNRRASGQSLWSRLCPCKVCWSAFTHKLLHNVYHLSNQYHMSYWEYWVKQAKTSTGLVLIVYYTPGVSHKKRLNKKNSNRGQRTSKSQSCFYETGKPQSGRKVKQPRLGWRGLARDMKVIIREVSHPAVV